MATKPKLAVFKFASCDGCQLSLLDAEDELLAVADAVEIAYFLEARTQQIAGPYDVGLVEGSVTTAHDANRIQEVRKQCRFLVTIGACATAGGIQALRNFADVTQYIAAVYPTPAYISTLRESTPIAAHVFVDFELRGCPVNKTHLVELISASLNGRRPVIPTSSVCAECKARGIVCGLITFRPPCLGPVTQAGCGALCPSFHRGCFGCFGPKEASNPRALGARWADQGMDQPSLVRVFRSFNAWAEPFRKASEAHEN